jgi:hypothetical protein
MESEGYSETLIMTYQTSRHYNQDGHNLHSHSHEIWNFDLDYCQYPLENPEDRGNRTLRSVSNRAVHGVITFKSTV